MRLFIVGLIFGLVVSTSPTGFAQGIPGERPRIEGTTQWAWPSGLAPTATLVGPAQVAQIGPVSIIITLTFRESSGAIKIVRMSWGGGPAPSEYTTFTLSPQR